MSINSNLKSYVDYVDQTLDVARDSIQHAPNGDSYLQFTVTTNGIGTNTEANEATVLNNLNDRLDPNNWDIFTGPTGSDPNKTTYTVIYDASNHDYALISGTYAQYHNDLAGTSTVDENWIVNVQHAADHTSYFYAYNDAAPGATDLGLYDGHQAYSDGTTPLGYLDGHWIV